MTTTMPPIEDRGRRVVLLHTTGPHAGLHQITGHTDDFHGPAPVFTGDFTITPGTRTGRAQLIACRRSFLLYHESFQMPTEAGDDRPRFAPSQR